MVKVLNFASLQEAWEGINMWMACASIEEIKENGGGGMYGTEYISYNNLIIANSAWVDPEFDFGKSLGYTNKKWSTLIKNYVDFDYLDLLKSEINYRREKNSRSYNYSFHFSNLKGGGKDCLISLIFSKRVEDPFPTVFFNVRTSEVTSRLIFDFLLVQRIIEYVYGKGQPAEVHFYAPSMFITAERFTVFAHWKGWDWVNEQMSDGRFQNRIRQVYAKFTDEPWETVKYKVHQRCAQMLQGGEKTTRRLKAKDLILSPLVDIEDKIYTQSQMKKLRKDAGI